MGIYEEIKVLDNEFMGLSVEMDGEPCSGDGTNQTIYADTTLYEM